MLTAERLRELLDYDPETGIFTRRTDNGRGCHIGDVVGTRDKLGYLWTYVAGREYTLGRLAWLHSTGQWPANEIDHINRIRDDNRLFNLREVTRHQNMQNSLKSGASGLPGARYRADRGKWTASIHVDGRTKRIGSFDNAEDAHRAYLQAKAKYHPGFNPD